MTDEPIDVDGILASLDPSLADPGDNPWGSAFCPLVRLPENFLDESDADREARLDYPVIILPDNFLDESDADRFAEKYAEHIHGEDQP